MEIDRILRWSCVNCRNCMRGRNRTARTLWTRSSSSELANKWKKQFASQRRPWRSRYPYRNPSSSQRWFLSVRRTASRWQFCRRWNVHRPPTERFQRAALKQTLIQICSSMSLPNWWAVCHCRANRQWRCWQIITNIWRTCWWREWRGSSGR